MKRNPPRQALFYQQRVERNIGKAREKFGVEIEKNRRKDSHPNNPWQIF